MSLLRHVFACLKSLFQAAGWNGLNLSVLKQCWLVSKSCLLLILFSTSVFEVGQFTLINLSINLLVLLSHNVLFSKGISTFVLILSKATVKNLENNDSSCVHDGANNRKNRIQNRRLQNYNFTEYQKI